MSRTAWQLSKKRIKVFLGMVHIEPATLLNRPPDGRTQDCKVKKHIRVLFEAMH